MPIGDTKCEDSWGSLLDNIIEDAPIFIHSDRPICEIYLKPFHLAYLSDKFVSECCDSGRNLSIHKHGIVDNWDLSSINK